jgi:hypothetical protein
VVVGKDLVGNNYDGRSGSLPKEGDAPVSVRVFGCLGFIRGQTLLFWGCSEVPGFGVVVGRDLLRSNYDGTPGSLPLKGDAPVSVKVTGF